MTENKGKVELYKKYKKDRDKYVLAVLQSDSPKKVIIAGPGTGKSYLFEKICKRNFTLGLKKNLVLSFINELVDDLVVKLDELAEVRTLHSFARSKIKKHDKYFLDLESIISKDYKIIYGKEINFSKILCRLINNDEAIKFYFDRREYYDYFSPTSSVYYLVKLLQKDRNNIPVYSQVLVDEFQDFNKLESTLIDLLAEKSPTLVVGDDDQSLYNWKHASPEEIRKRGKSSTYKSFELPYCSRSTKVITDAFNCIVKQAKNNSLLDKRQDRPFKYFASEKNDLKSSKYSTISVRKKVYQGSEAFYIDAEIKKHINLKNNANVSVLVICPFKKHVESVTIQLRKKGYRNISSRVDRNSSRLLEGFNLLLQNNTCNLGWRIVAGCILNRKKFDQVLKKSYEDKKKSIFRDNLDLKSRKYIKFILATIRKIKNKKGVEKIDLEKVAKCLGYKQHMIISDKIRNDMETTNNKRNMYKNIPIKVTTIQGSKGLEGDYVFLVNFDERLVLSKGKTNITDETIRKFLVALTRARKRLFIFSSVDKLPAFVNWLDNKLYEIN